MMNFHVGDDGELEFIEEIEEGEKPKRKRKPKPHSLRARLPFVIVTLLLILSAGSGFALYFVQNSKILPRLQNIARANACTRTIDGLRATNDFIFFQEIGTNAQADLMKLSLDGQSSSRIPLPQRMQSFDLAGDDIHLVGSRLEPVSPNWFVFEATLGDSGLENERIIIDGRYPSWSPDGKQIAFFRVFEGDMFKSETSTLFIMNADGSNVHFVRNTGRVDSPAIWSPDGTQLLISTSQLVSSTSEYNEMDWRDKTFYIITPDSQTNQELINSTILLEPFNLAWSSDSSTIAYTARIGHVRDLFTSNLNGSNEVNLTRSLFAEVSDTAWSPDARSLIFIGMDATYQYGVFQINRDGSDLHLIYDPCAEK